MDNIDEKMILFKSKFETAEEGIKVAGKILFEQGYAEEKYIDSMVNNFIENGSYFVLTPGLAIPHGRPEDGVLRTGMSVVILKEGIEFGNEFNDPVRVILGLAAKDSDEHLLFMSKLAKVLNKEDIVLRLAESETKEEVINLLKIEE